MYLCCEVAFCSTLWTTSGISSKLTHILIWDSQNDLSDFGDLDFIYKVTRDIYKKGLSVFYLPNQWPDFDQTDTYNSLGRP